MIWIFRHMGVQLWASCLFAIPLSFVSLSKLTQIFPGISPFAVGSMIFVLTSILFSFLMDTAGRKRLDALIKEAQTWERSGIFQKAEKKYVHAVRVYDTFLLWPFSTRKAALNLSRAIAGFQLGSGSIHPDLKAGTSVYLRMNPQDRDMAGLWLRQISKASIVTSMDQEILTSLAGIYSGDEKISALIKDIFQKLERNDYVAQRLYQGETDGLEQVGQDYDSLRGPAAELGQETMIRPQIYDFSEPEATRKQLDIGNMVSQGGASAAAALKRFFLSFGLLFETVVQACSKGTNYLKEHEKIRFYLKAGLASFICGGLVFFMISTLAHNLKTRAAEKKKIEIEASIPKPFTIQVAAYLKIEHAQRYIDTLKKHQIDAVIKKVNGGGKTWFVVRVSKFADKKSAAEYGNQLKQEGIIEDFFVNNR